MVATAPPGWVVTLDKPTRTRLQNNYLHALLTDIAEQLPAPDGTGEFHDKDWWKPRCTLQWLLDKEEAGEVITSLDGRRRFGLLIPHTSDLNTGECAELCEWIRAYGDTNGVTFKEPSPKGDGR
jgi:hypothetical protein